MKRNRYSMMFVLAAACSTVHAQDAFRNLALVEATGTATTAPTVSSDFFIQPVSTGASTAATTITPATPKDVQTAPVARTLIGGGGETSRPAYEGRAQRRSSAPSITTSAKGEIVESVPYETGDSATDLAFMVEGGYYTKYFYHGLDQVDAASSGTSSSGAIMLGVSGTWEGFFFGYKYAVATDETIAGMDTTVRERYSEHIFEAGYSVGILPQGWLDLSASYQYIIFGDDAFWGNGAQGRFMVKAEMNRYQWFRPSIAYYDFQGIDENAVKIDLDGQQLIFQIQGGGEVYEHGPVTFGVSYYVLAGMDEEYNGAGNLSDVNYYQAGISFPIIYQNLTVAPSFHWFKGVDQGIPNYDETWAGLQATYRF